MTTADAIAAIRAAQDKAMPIDLGLDGLFPYDIGATGYIREGYRDRVVAPYKVLGYNIRGYGVTIVLYPDDPAPQGDVPIHRRLDQVYGTKEDAERGGT